MTLHLCLCKGSLKRVMISFHLCLGVAILSCHCPLTRADWLPDSLWQFQSLPLSPAFLFWGVWWCFSSLTSFLFKNMKLSNFSIRYECFFFRVQLIYFFFPSDTQVPCVFPGKWDELSPKPSKINISVK